jgi:hypothetical protein
MTIARLELRAALAAIPGSDAFTACQALFTTETYKIEGKPASDALAELENRMKLVAEQETKYFMREAKSWPRPLYAPD